MRWTRFIIVSMIVAVVAFGAYPPKSGVFGTPSSETLTPPPHKSLKEICNCKKIKQMKQKYKKPCDKVKKLIGDIFSEYNKLQNTLDDAKKRREEARKSIENLGKELYKKANSILKRHMKLFILAKEAGLLLPPNLAKVAYVDPNLANNYKGPKIFGIPLQAYTFDPEKIALLNKIKEEDKKLVEEWDKVRDNFLKQMDKIRNNFNSAMNKKRREFQNSVDKINQLREQLLNMFKSNEYEHCLGNSKDIPPSQIPGMSPPLDENFMNKYGAYFNNLNHFPIVPYGIVALKNIPLVRDGRQAIKAQIDLLHDSLKNQSLSTKIHILQGIYYTIKAARDASVGVYRGMYETAKGAVNPALGAMNKLYHGKGWESLKTLGYGYGKFVKDLTWGQVKAIGKDAKDLVLSVSEMGAKLASKEGQGSIGKFMKDIYQYASSVIDYHMQGANKASGYKSGYGSSSENPQEDLKQIDKLNKMLQGLKGINQGLDNAVKNYNKYVLDNAQRLFNLYMAVGGGEGLRGAKSFAKGAFGEIAKKGVVEGTKGIAKKAAEQKIQKGKQIIEKGKKIAKGAKESAKRAKESMKNLKELKKKIAENYKQYKKNYEGLEKKIEYEQKYKEYLAKNELVRKAYKKVDLEKLGNIKPLGEGSLKKVYKTIRGGKVEVMKVITDKSKVANEMARQVMTAERLRKAGLAFDKYNIVRTKSGEMVVVQKMLNPKTFGDTIIKEGKWTKEHSQALMEYVAKANKKGYIITDVKPDNFRFVKTKSGKIKAVLMDLDGVVSAKELVQERGGKVVLPHEGFKEIDLSNPKNIQYLQKTLLLKKLNQQQVGPVLAQLGTKNYHVSYQQGLYGISGSAGGFVEALKKKFGENYKKFFNEKLYEKYFQKKGTTKKATVPRTSTATANKIKNELDAMLKEFDNNKLPGLPDLNINF